jgi:hypothetical protein
MDVSGMAISALAAVALPLVGLGPLVRRLLGPLGCVAAAGILAAIVYWLTGLLWATAFTGCLGIAPVLPRRLRLGERLAVAFRVDSERRSAWR